MKKKLLSILSCLAFVLIIGVGATVGAVFNNKQQYDAVAKSDSTGVLADAGAREGDYLYFGDNVGSADAPLKWKITPLGGTQYQLTSMQTIGASQWNASNASYSSASEVYANASALRETVDAFIKGNSFSEHERGLIEELPTSLTSSTPIVTTSAVNGIKADYWQWSACFHNITMGNDYCNAYVTNSSSSCASLTETHGVVPVITIDLNKSLNVFYAHKTDDGVYRLFYAIGNSAMSTTLTTEDEGNDSYKINLTDTYGSSTENKFVHTVIHKANDIKDGNDVVSFQYATTATATKTDTANFTINMGNTYTSYQIYRLVELNSSFARKGMAEVQVLKVNDNTLDINNIRDRNSKKSPCDVVIPKLFGYTNTGLNIYNKKQTNAFANTLENSLMNIEVRDGYFLNTYAFKSKLNYTAANGTPYDFSKLCNSWKYCQTTAAFDKESVLSKYNTLTHYSGSNGKVYLWPEMTLTFTEQYNFMIGESTTTNKNRKYPTVVTSVDGDKINSDAAFVPTKTFVAREGNEIFDGTYTDEYCFGEGYEFDQEEYAGLKTSDNNNNNKEKTINFGGTASFYVPSKLKQYTITYKQATYDSGEKSLKYGDDHDTTRKHFTVLGQDGGIPYSLGAGSEVSCFTFKGWTTTKPTNPLDTTATVDYELEDAITKEITLYPLYTRKTKTITFTDTDQVEFASIMVSRWNGTGYEAPSPASVIVDSTDSHIKTLTVTTIIDKVTFNANIGNQYYASDAKIKDSLTAKCSEITYVTGTGVVNGAEGYTSLTCALNQLLYTTDYEVALDTKLELVNYDITIALAEGSEDKITWRFADDKDTLGDSISTPNAFNAETKVLSAQINQGFTLNIIPKEGYTQNIGKVSITGAGVEQNGSVQDGYYTIGFTSKQNTTITINANNVGTDIYQLATNLGGYCTISNNNITTKIVDNKEKLYINDYRAKINYSFSLTKTAPYAKRKITADNIVITGESGAVYGKLSASPADISTKGYVSTRGIYYVYGINEPITVKLKDIVRNLYSVQMKNMNDLSAKDCIDSITYSISHPEHAENITGTITTVQGLMSNEIKHGSEISIRIKLKDEYSDMTLMKSNLLIGGISSSSKFLASYIEGVDVAKESDNVFIYTIKGIKNDLTEYNILDVSVSNAVKNKYEVTARNNENIDKFIFTTALVVAEHGTNAVLTYEKIEGYTNAVPSPDNLIIKYANDEVITDFIINDEEKTITINNVTSNVTVSLTNQSSVDANVYNLVLTKSLNDVNPSYQIVELNGAYGVVTTEGDNPQPIASSNFTYGTSKLYLIGINYVISPATEENLLTQIGKIYVTDNSEANIELVTNQANLTSSMTDVEKLEALAVWSINNNGELNKSYYKALFTDSSFNGTNFYAYAVKISNVKAKGNIKFIISNNEYRVDTRTNDVYRPVIEGSDNFEVSLKTAAVNNFIEFNMDDGRGWVSATETVVTPKEWKIRFRLSNKYNRLEGTNSDFVENFKVYSHYNFLTNPTGGTLEGVLTSVKSETFGNNSYYVLHLAPLTGSIVIKLDTLEERQFYLNLPTPDSKYRFYNEDNYAGPAITDGENLENPIAAVVVKDMSAAANELDPKTVGSSISAFEMSYGRKYDVTFTIKHYYSQFFLNGFSAFKETRVQLTSNNVEKSINDIDGTVTVTIHFSESASSDDLTIGYNVSDEIIDMINEYTITKKFINSDGADSTVSTSKIKFNGIFNEVPVTPSKYRFAGWYESYTKEAGLESKYWNGGDDPKHFYDNSDKTLFADYQVREFNVNLKYASSIDTVNAPEEILQTIESIKYGSTLKLVFVDGIYKLIVNEGQDTETTKPISDIPLIPGYEGYVNGIIVNAPCWKILNGRVLSDINLDQELANITSAMGSDITLQAYYTINSYGISFKEDVPDTGTGALEIGYEANSAVQNTIQGAPVSVNYKANINLARIANRRGITGGVFAGWTIAGQNANEYFVTNDESVLGYLKEDENKVVTFVPFAIVSQQGDNGAVLHGYINQKGVFVPIDMSTGVTFVASYNEYVRPVNVKFTIKDGELHDNIINYILNVRYLNSVIGTFNNLVANKYQIPFTTQSGKTEYLKFANYEIALPITSSYGEWTDGDRIKISLDTVVPELLIVLQTRGKIFTFINEGEDPIIKTVSIGESISSLQLPAITRKAGYDQVSPYWDYNFAEHSEVVTSENNDPVTVKSIYTINRYSITIKMPDGTDVVKEVKYGESIEVPTIKLKFGQYLSYNKKATQGIVDDGIIEIKVKSYLIWIILGGVLVLLAIATIAVIAIVKAISRDKAIVKQSSTILDKLREQDARMAQKGLVPGQKPSAPNSGVKPNAPQGPQAGTRPGVPPMGPRPNMPPKPPVNPQDPNKPKV